MKKNIFYVGALFLGLILGTSCSEEDGLVKNKQTLVEATINNPASRTTVSSEYKVVWSQGDAYTVWSSEGAKKGDLTLATGEGSTTGSFTGTLNSELANGDVALFPSVSGESKSYTFNSEYSTTETDAPMLGTYNGTSFSFNHLAAFIRVNANDLPAGDAVLTIESTNQALAGEATLTAENALIPTEGKTVTVTFNAKEGDDLVFDAPIPAQAYDKITLTLKVGETEIFQKERALNAEVGNLYELTSTKMTVEEANTVLAGLKDNKSLNVNISGLTDDATIAVPTAEGSVLNMDISNVSSESSITIKNNEGASVGESQQNIGVNVANDESSAIDMTINTPTATVEVGKGYFTTVTATTATNTLIVGKGVTITNLVVAAGNVRIEGGKITTSITNDNGNEVVYVIADQTDADTYKGLSDAVKASITKIECTSDIWVEVNTASGLYAASLGAKNIKLGADITITADKPVNPKNGQIYDLNGKKVAVATTGAKDVFRIEEAGAVVTIKNGTIDNQTGNNYALSVRADNVTLNMENVTIPVNSYDGSLHKNGNYTGSTISLTNCNFNGVVYLSNTDDKTANTLNVSGGSFASATQNCFELLNTNAIISGATLTNELTEQKYTANGNSGNSFSNPQGYCIAFTNNDGKAAKGSATLSGNTYNIADTDGKYIFNQMNGAEISMTVNTVLELYSAASVAKNIKLGADITITADKPVNPKNGQTYDLNDHEVEVTEGTKDVFRIEEAGAVVTIKNGTIDNQTGNNYALSVRADNVTLNMEGITIPANSYDGSLHKNGNYTGSTISLTNCNFNGVVYLSNTDDKTANTLNVSGGSFASATQNCFELLNTNAIISGATLTNELTEQKYTANGNSGNSFSNPQGYCIAFTNNDGKAAKGSATLSGNTYNIADTDGKYIFNQMNGAEISMTVNTVLELYSAASVAKNIKLGADITITADKPVNPKNGQTYDLNDHEVEVTEGTKDVFRIEEAGAVVTIKNGTIDNQTGNNYALSVRADNVTLNMEGITIPANSYDGSLHKNGNYTGSTVSLTNCNFNGVVYLSNTDDKTANTLNVSGGSFASAKQNCFELLNTNATISGAKLTNTLEKQKYTANGNSGNSFSNPQGYCIAFTNNDGKAAKGSAALSDNTYSIADTDGKYIFNQMNGVKITGVDNNNIEGSIE